MDLSNLKDNSYKLIAQMEADNYHISSIDLIKHALKFIFSFPDEHWKSYDEIRDAYLANEVISESYRAARKTAITKIMAFDLYGNTPNSFPSNDVLQKSAYYKLENGFRALVDEYDDILSKELLAPKSRRTYSYGAASVLYCFNQIGITTLEQIEEQHILHLFTDNGVLKGESSNLCFRRFLKKINIDPVLRNRLLELIPKVKDVEKVIEYLTPKEAHAIKTVFQTEGILSLRERAIAAMIYFTGLRAVDISNLKLTDIDWETDTLHIIQDKTDVPLVLPLEPSYGNLLFRYIKEERRDCDEEYVFLKKSRPYGKIPPSLITNHILNLVYDAANVRMNPGDRRGSHIFRHHAVSSMLSSGISGLVISASLGHSSQSSLQPYLNSDFSHLKQCALSIEMFPIVRGPKL